MHMKRQFIFGLVAVALAANLTLGAKVYLEASKDAGTDSPYENLELFSYVLERVKKEYVDGESLTYRALVRDALEGMVGKLDPHSEFLDPDKFKDLQTETKGQFGGLGIVVQMRDGFVTVVAPIEDTPGFRAGILSGDRIVKIEGKSTEKLSIGDVLKQLRGEPGTAVSLTVQRPATGETKDYSLTRAIINVDMVKDINGKREFPMGEAGIGYIRLSQFGERTAEELEAALKKLKAQNLKGLVLDLRWNPGGLLDQAVEVCEKFLPRGQLVVSTEGRNAAQNSVRKAAGRGDEIKGVPIVVLVNFGSASAAEIVAGCLQDLQRAIVVGEQTFGKGSVQSVVELEGGAALRLTTAKYYTPSHKVIHEKGITPDVEVLLSDEEERDLLTQRAPGGVESLSGVERQRVAEARDPQLERAVDLLKGINLFTERIGRPEKLKSGKMAAKGAEELLR
jgi:carboxyl-terminal processing protease